VGQAAAQVEECSFPDGKQRRLSLNFPGTLVVQL
jgi:hypothetical protein